MFKRLIGLLYWYIIGRRRLQKWLSRPRKVRGLKTSYEKDDIKIATFQEYWG